MAVAINNKQEQCTNTNNDGNSTDTTVTTVTTTATSNSRATGSGKYSTSLSRNLSTSPSVRTVGQESSLSARIYYSTNLQRRRKQTLLISILDVLVALGLLIYHTSRIIIYFSISESKEIQRDYDTYSPVVFILWFITFLIIVLHIGMAILLLTSCYANHCTDHEEISKTKKKVNCWIITSQLLMTIWIIKLTVFTSSSLNEYKLGVLNIIVEDYSSIWFVLIFYSILIVFRGIGIYFVRQYVNELP